MRRGLAVTAAVLLAAAASGTAAGAELPSATGAGGNLRTGWYPDEPSLAPAQIKEGSFRKVFNTQVEGQVYAQPLIADGTLLVVTEKDWAYGLDPVTGAIKWQRQFGSPVEAGVGKTVECTDLEPFLGITGTPVIDAEHGIAYFTSTSYTKPGETAWFMNAVQLASGSELPNFPKEIAGVAQNLSGVEFEAAQELQRPALLLMNGVVYAAFGSHCDHIPYEGWIVGVAAGSGAVVTKWATSANGDSIWQAGGGLVSDGPGQILFSSGNDSVQPGVWDPPVGEKDTIEELEGHLGESVVRVEANGSGALTPRNYFTPFDAKSLDEADLDLGSSAPVGLPSPYFGTEKAPNLLVQEGKTGEIYLLNRDSLGGRGKTSNKVVQEIVGDGGVWGAAAVWPGEGGFLAIPEAEHLRFFRYEKAAVHPLSEVGKTPDRPAFGSGSPVITSNGVGSGSGMLWVTWCPESGGCEHAELRAYDPAGGSSFPEPLWKESIGWASKFTRPGVSDGHIYVGNHEGEVFGFSGPMLEASSDSVDLSAPVGRQATAEITLTATGTELTVGNVSSPAAPFQVTGLPAPGRKLIPGEAIKLSVTFTPSSLGTVGGGLSVVTEAGETRVALAGTGTTEPPPGASAATARVFPAALAAPALVELTKLKVLANASRLKATSAQARRLLHALRARHGRARGLPPCVRPLPAHQRPLPALGGNQDQAEGQRACRAQRREARPRDAGPRSLPPAGDAPERLRLSRGRSLARIQDAALGTEGSPPAQRDRRPDRLHDAKRPGARQEPIGARQRAAAGEREHEPPTATLERVHEQHERQCRHAEGGQHGLSLTAPGDPWRTPLYFV